MIRGVPRRVSSDSLLDFRGCPKMQTAIQRAFELARSGKCNSIEGICKVLRSEGLSAAQIEGPLLRKQLRGLISDALVKPLHDM